MDRKSKLVAGLDLKNSVGTEIGALCRPIITSDDGKVLYIDHTDTASLREKYRNDPTVDIDAIVNVDGVWGCNTLSEALSGQKVDYVVASHVIEHAPDLITWLSELRSILTEGGQIRLAIPDRRFTFDYFRRESALSDVLQNYLVRARIPQSHSILDFCLNAAKIDCIDAWNGDINRAAIEYLYTAEQAINLAKDAIANGNYHDVHCWVFTPRSFAALFAEMAEAGLIDFGCASFSDTETYQLEFFVALRPCGNRSELIESWRHMQDAVCDAGPAKPSCELDDSRKQSFGTPGEITHLQKVLSLKDEQLRIALRRIADLEKSNSWKVTQPLRSLSRIVRR